MKRAALLVMGAVLVFAPATPAKAPVNTRVTIDAAFYCAAGGAGTCWSGDIFSSRRSCKNRRLVKLFRIRPGADQRIGATRSKVASGSRYRWFFSKPGAAPTGKYYVKVSPIAGCRGDRSGNETLAGF